MEIGARLIYDTDAKKPKVQRPRSFLTCKWQPQKCARYTSVLACASAGLGFRIVRIAETLIRFAPTEETSRSARVSAIPDVPAPPLGMGAPHRILRLVAGARVSRSGSLLAGATFTPAQPPSLVNSPGEKTNR